MTAPLVLLALPACIAALDPAPGLARTKAFSNDLECERLDARSGAERYPGQIRPPGPRGELFERDLMVCAERLARPGLRSPREEAILWSLEPATVGIAETAVSLRPDLARHTWLVEAFDTSAAVTAKISFATKNALVGRGLQVSDRTPVLSAGDVDVITRMEPDEAYPTACRRWYDTGSLDDGDALLAVVTRDPRETFLHAGLCVSGGWSWLR